MNIRISVNEYENEKAHMLAYANVVIEDKYVLENVKIKSGQSGRYVELPKIATPKTDENKKVITNIYGRVEYDYQDIFHAISKDANKQFYEAVLTEYKNVIENGGSKAYYANCEQGKKGSEHTIDGDFNLTRVTGGVHDANREDDYLRGLATVGFGEFVLEKVKIKANRENGNLYIDLPKYKTIAKDEKGKKLSDENGNQLYDYKEAFHPITVEAYNELNNAVIQMYNEKLAQKQAESLAVDNGVNINTDLIPDNAPPQMDITPEGIPLDFDDLEQTGGRK